MPFNSGEYEKIINNFYGLMEKNEDIANIKLSGDKWTLKEMVSHLIDSASNNHQRFIRLQLASRLTFPAYDAEQWKNTTNIKDFDFSSLISLWKYYNYFLLYLIKQIDKTSLDNVWEADGKGKTLKALIEDYFVRHMNWHIDLYNDRIQEIKQHNSK